MGESLEERFAELKRILAGMGRVAVAFSGGVDSAFLLAAAHEVLGDDAFALTIDSAFCPESETAEARAFCEGRDIPHEVIWMDVLEAAGVAGNPPDRCYWCKQALMARMAEEARARAAQLVEGSNASDAGAYRPGARALKELGIASPLAQAALTKADIRTLSRKMGLPTWDKPSLACLATRFPYGEPITPDGLARVEAAEAVLHGIGFTQVRVRAHGNVARIEADPVEMTRLMDADVRQRVYDAFKDLGFDYAAADLLGYRTGSADEVLEDA